jgi:hypothetical protein
MLTKDEIEHYASKLAGGHEFGDALQAAANALIGDLGSDDRRAILARASDLSGSTIIKIVRRQGDSELTHEYGIDYLIVMIFASYAFASKKERSNLHWVLDTLADLDAENAHAVVRRFLVVLDDPDKWNHWLEERLEENTSDNDEETGACVAAAHA